MTVHAQVKDPAQWTAETPNLYVVDFTLRAGGKELHRITQRFGFRIVAGLIVFGFTLQLTAIHVMNNLRRLPDDLLVIAQMIGGGKL